LIRLNENGSRIVTHKESGFEIRLPNNTLPFTDGKNLQAINLMFPYIILKKLNLHHVFFPLLKSGEVPSRSERRLSKKIIQSLGLTDTSILSSERIESLKRSFIILSTIRKYKSPKENLKQLAIISSKENELKQNTFFRVVEVIRESKNLSMDSIQEKLLSRFVERNLE